MSEPSTASFVGWFLGLTGIKEGSRLEWNYGIFTASSHSTWEGSEIVIFKEEEKATELKRDYFIIKVGWEFIRAYSVWIILSCQLKGERRCWALVGISHIALPSTKGCCFILFRHLPGGDDNSFLGGLKKRRNWDDKETHLSMEYARGELHHSPFAGLDGGSDAQMDEMKYKLQFLSRLWLLSYRTFFPTNIQSQ